MLIDLSSFDLIHGLDFAYFDLLPDFSELTVEALAERFGVDYEF